MFSCTSGVPAGNKEVITVSILPFKYFIDKIGGDDFDVNVMVPPGADPHIYEPAPQQITALSRSVAYLSDGYLGFEMTWLDRFYEANTRMKKINLGKDIDLILATEDHGEHQEGADPHYWSTPRSAAVIAADVKNLLCSLKPAQKEKYEKNFSILADSIASLDTLARKLFAGMEGSTFMIFHPALGYLARDYHINQLAVEREGKEPDPGYMKSLIDEAKGKHIKKIFIQKGFDIKNASAIASETGAVIRELDPLGEDWYANMKDIIVAVHGSLIEGKR